VHELKAKVSHRRRPNSRSVAAPYRKAFLNVLGVFAHSETNLVASASWKGSVR
jgi:hypothetical protein